MKRFGIGSSTPWRRVGSAAAAALALAAVSSLASCGAGEEGAASGERLWVANAGSGTLSVVDVLRGEVVETVELAEPGMGSHGIAITPDERFVYAADMKTGDVFKIDTESLATVATIPTETDGHGIDITPDGRWVFVSGSERVAVIETATDEVAKTLSTESPSHITASPDSRFVYLTNLLTHQVSVIDVAKREIVSAVTVGPAGWAVGTFDAPGGWGPNEVAVSPDGSRVYSADYDSGTITTIDVTTPAEPSVVAVTEVGGTPHGVVCSPDGGELWIANRSTHEVAIFDTKSRKVVSRIDLGDYEANHVAFSADGETVYVTATSDDTPKDRLLRIDATARTVLGHVEVGDAPHELSAKN
jgi:YVTN family beta-propeller protein